MPLLQCQNGLAIAEPLDKLSLNQIVDKRDRLFSQGSLDAIATLAKTV
ncbi:MAG: hypothetical protein J7647_05250 [Cyanobacteria bacterium SBLK]|nr:hypothetical protein [Cyanobacteria bacterium SBLK]